MINLQLERFRQLLRQPGVIWQGGVFRMPAWTMGDDGKPYRPLIAMWADAQTGRVATPRVIENEEPEQAALDGLIDFALMEERRAHRPFAIEVSDSRLAAFLKEKLDRMGTRVDLVTHLPATQAFLDDLAGHLNKRTEPPGALSGKGVGVDQMQAFAAAAKRFHAAHPWEELSDEDLIVVDHPAPPPGMAIVSVLGYAGQVFGLGFFADLKQHEKMCRSVTPGRFFAKNSAWSLTYCDMTELPFADADLWEDYQLPVAGPEAYPCALWYGPKKQIRRPDAGELAYIEGLLHALASTTAEQLDAGRWSRRVKAGGRDVEYRLALVHEIEAPGERTPESSLASPHDLRRAMEKGMADIQRLLADQQFDSLEAANDFLREKPNTGKATGLAPGNPLERAQEVMYQAWEAHGRRRRMMAEQALEICPDCADAYVMLAEESPQPAKACEFYRQGVIAGERALGTSVFNEEVGRFWGLIETRPYMRARFGLAQCLWGLGEKQEAVSHYHELLRLNPGDNQGVRYLLAACLLELGDDDQLGNLLNQYAEEDTAHWLYLRALWVYRREGDSPIARRQVKEAIKSNRFVPDLLTGDRRMPSRIPDAYRLGYEDEAQYCAAELRDAWTATPGAIDWLAKRLDSRRRG